MIMRYNEFIWQFLISPMKTRKIVSLLKVAIVILFVVILSIVTAEDDGVDRRMRSAISFLKHTILGLNVGRATTALLDPIKVEVYGENKKINQLGTISVADPRLITIQVWDPTQVQPVEKAILTSGLGLNPSTDGQMIRVPIPPISEERRRELTKKAADYGENAKVAVRNLRREAAEKLKSRYKSKEISEDEMKNGTEDLQKKTDSYIRQIDEIIKQKNNEIMGVSKS